MRNVRKSIENFLIIQYLIKKNRVNILDFFVGLLFHIVIKITSVYFLLLDILIVHTKKVQNFKGGELKWLKTAN